MAPRHRSVPSTVSPAAAGSPGSPSCLAGGRPGEQPEPAPPAGPRKKRKTTAVRRSLAQDFVHRGDQPLDLRPSEEGVLPAWHISIPAPGQRGAWLEGERLRLARLLEAGSGQHADLGEASAVGRWNTCGFCGGKFRGSRTMGSPGVERHLESKRHQKKMEAVQNGTDPDGRAFREYFGLEHPSPAAGPSA